MPIRIHSIEAGLGWCHLIENAHGLVLVDAGSPGNAQKILRRMDGLDRRDLQLIVITHAHLDHYGSAAEMRRATGAPIGVHEADAAAMARGETHLGAVRKWGRVVKRVFPLVERRLRPEPTHADMLLSDGDALDAYGLDAKVIHTPGHTPGSCTIFTEERIAFVGDLASQSPWPHAQMFYADDWSQLARSVEAVQALDPLWVYTGHGGRPIRGDVFQRMRAKG